MNDPLEMLDPEFFLTTHAYPREALVPNIHYLHDRGYVELLIGYRPPLFAGARITAKGIDLVENRFEFNRLFPPELDEATRELAALPALVEQLLFEAEMAPLDGEARHALLRDVQFVREELARPAHRWRKEVILAVLGWMAHGQPEAQAAMPAREEIRAILETCPVD